MALSTSTPALTIIEHGQVRLALWPPAGNLRVDRQPGSRVWRQSGSHPSMRLTQRNESSVPGVFDAEPCSGRHNRKDLNMKQTAIALALLGASTLGFTQTSHAMSLPGQSVLKEVVPSHTSEVYWRRGGGWWGPGIGLGLGVGLAAGALTAAAFGPWGGGYWGGYPGYAYGPGYGYGYGYAPGYGYGRYDYAPAYSTAYGPTYSYSYGPSYAYGTTYVRPRARYSYARVGTGVRYANTWGSGVRSTDSSGPRYRAAGSRIADRVVERRR